MEYPLDCGFLYDRLCGQRYQPDRSASDLSVVLCACGSRSHGGGIPRNLHDGLGSSGNNFPGTAAVVEGMADWQDRICRDGDWAGMLLLYEDCARAEAGDQYVRDE